MHKSHFDEDAKDKFEDYSQSGFRKGFQRWIMFMLSSKSPKEAQNIQLRYTLHLSTFAKLLTLSNGMQSGVKKELVIMLQRIYESSNTFIIVNKEKKAVDFRKGIRQGDTLSSLGVSISLPLDHHREIDCAVRREWLAWSQQVVNR